MDFYLTQSRRVFLLLYLTRLKIGITELTYGTLDLAYLDPKRFGREQLELFQWTLCNLILGLRLMNDAELKGWLRTYRTYENAGDGILHRTLNEFVHSWDVLMCDRDTARSHFLSARASFLQHAELPWWLRMSLALLPYSEFFLLMTGHKVPLRARIQGLLFHDWTLVLRFFGRLLREIRWQANYLWQCQRRNWKERQRVSRDFQYLGRSNVGFVRKQCLKLCFVVLRFAESVTRRLHSKMWLLRGNSFRALKGAGSNETR